ncbi:MAG: hypothetical protein ACSHYF_11565 [Verrucomicrobiaceae bacterium]
MRSALENVPGVQSADVQLNQPAKIKGTASAEALVAAVNGIPGGKYSATAE